MSPEAAAELRAAIDFLKTHHMNRDKVDWPAVEAHAFEMARDAKTPAETYPAINYVIARLGEKHTFLISAASMKANLTDLRSASNAVPPGGVALGRGIGLLRVTTYLGEPKDDRAYVDALRAPLREFYANGVCRFIVDLRGNSGGGMWPMVNGIASLLGAPPYGYFTSADKPKEAWVLRNNWMGFEREGISPPDPELEASQGAAPVAILIDRRTASAGEFTAIALEGRTRTRVFGEPSAGYLTANVPFFLPDGALMGVSDGWSEDRLGRPYHVAVVPDQETPAGQATVDAAKRWLQAQSCSPKN
jgi:C-terminal processing protease CtpA/Prc